VPVLLELAAPVSVLLVLAPVFLAPDGALLVAPGHLLPAVLGGPLQAAAGPPGALRRLVLVQAGLRVDLPSALVDARSLVSSTLLPALGLPSAASPVAILLNHG